MSTVSERRYTPEEYLALERGAEYKNEYVNGRIYALAGATRAHIVITLNISAQLHTRFRGRPCEVYPSEMRVKVSPTGMYTYPDVVAVCGEPLFEDSDLDTLLNPTVIVEVLSPSTEAYDRGEKFAHYRRLETLSEYVLVAQDKLRVEHYSRDGERWVLTEISDPEGALSLPAVGCEIPLREIYERVEFDGSDRDVGRA